jgi:3-hydroxyacyl-[acyl-carrier-protein] dehydratase
VASSTADRAAIEALIPHRAPFLFVDRIVERGTDRIVCEWDVPSDLAAFRGHYPGTPVLPGVLISEFAFQSAACLFASESRQRVDPRAVPVLVRIEDARFRRIVHPGETLRATVDVIERVGPARYCKGIVTCADEIVLRARFTVTETAPQP